MPSKWIPLQPIGTTSSTPRSLPTSLRPTSACKAARLGKPSFFLLANQGAFSQQTYLPGFEQAQGSQSDHHNFAQDWSHLGVNGPSATQMQYGPVHHHPTTMHGTPAWFCQQSKDVCNATATPSFPIAEEAWNSSSVPAVNPSHAAPHMDGTARLSVGDDEHVSFGKQTLSSSTLEAPTVSDEGTTGNTILSGSSRPCSCPVL